jgi:hypothetical protein
MAHRVMFAPGAYPAFRWLLPQCAVEYDGLFLYYPLRASLAPKLRVFIDVAKAVLANR